jgi:hypothetical protein
VHAGLFSSEALGVLHVLRELLVRPSTLERDLEQSNKRHAFQTGLTSVLDEVLEAATKHIINADGRYALQPCDSS